MDDEYVTVKIPKALIEEIDKIIRTHKELGFKSRAEVIKHTTRELILRLKESK